ncbi:MAG TPA: hypothetical protein VD971_03735 [Phycisphaerales bacterium]|nr:hypothetical protein [Phycisphaerales bacterium]
MSVLPEKAVDLIEFCETHVPVWAAAAGTIGLTAAQVATLNELTGDARGAYDDALAAREASKAATTKMRGGVSTMRTQAATLVRAIKNYAEAQADPASIYAAAQIPPPAEPAPLPAPGKPTNITVTLQPSGAITIAWDAENAAASTGAFFNVLRKLPGESAFVGIGGAPGSTSLSRRMGFTDGSVPTAAAASGVRYIVQGQRGTLVGLPSDAIVVQFGTDTPGGLSVTGADAIKMAA